MTETHYERVRRVFTGREKVRHFLEKLVEADPEIPLWGILMEATQSPAMSVNEMTTVFAEVVRRGVEQVEDPFSYGLLTRNSDYVGLVNYLQRTTVMPAADLMVMMTTEHQMICHERAGKRVYDVSPALAEKLAHTELRGLTTDDLRLPYESVYIITPPSAGLRVFNSETGWHRCVGMYVTEDRYVTLDETEPVNPVTNVLEKDHGEVETTRGWRFLVCGEALEPRAQDLAMAGSNDALSFFKVFLLEGQSLDDAISDTKKRMARDMARLPTTAFANMEEEWQRLFTWAMNAMLYATWTEPGEHWIANREARQLWERMKKMPANSRKRGNLQKRFQKMEPRRRIVLGRGVSASSNSSSEGTGTKLTVRTRVTGHWRNQAHGPGRRDRKLIWIEPFWQGPEDGIMGPSTHEVR